MQITVRVRSFWAFECGLQSAQCMYGPHHRTVRMPFIANIMRICIYIFEIKSYKVYTKTKFFMSLLSLTHTYTFLTNIGNATVKSDVKLVFVSECIILFVSLSLLLVLCC